MTKLTEERIREIVQEEIAKDKQAYADSMRPIYQAMSDAMRAVSEKANERREATRLSRLQHEEAIA
jgi:hypothetical protein